MSSGAAAMEQPYLTSILVLNWQFQAPTTTEMPSVSLGEISWDEMETYLPHVKVAEKVAEQRPVDHFRVYIQVIKISTE